MGVVATVWYYALAVIGGLLSIAALLARKRPGITDAAENVDNLYGKLYADVKHERRLVDESLIVEYGLDPNFYTTTTTALQALGFRRMADYVNCHLEKAAPWSKVVTRAFLSADGTVIGFVYNVRFDSSHGGSQTANTESPDFRTTEFETELSDGTFVQTSNATSAGKTLEIPGISRRFFPRTLPPGDLLANHHQHLLVTAPFRQVGVAPLVLKSFDDLCEASDRRNQLKSRHRNSADFDMVAEIAKVAGKPLTVEQQEMARQAADLHAQRTSSSADKQ